MQRKSMKNVAARSLVRQTRHAGEIQPFHSDAPPFSHRHPHAAAVRTRRARTRLRRLEGNSVLRPQQLHVVVGRHLPQRPRHALGALDAHAAPPEDGLDALGHRQPPVVPQRRHAQLRVPPASMTLLASRRGPSGRQGGIEACEQGPRPDQRNETAAGFAEPFVRVDDAPVGQAPLVAEIGPEHRPLEEPLSPPFHLAGSLDTEQLLGKRSQLHARLELQPRAGDQHHRVAGHPYPAHEHDAARRVNRVAHRPYVPERRRPPAERPPRPGMSPCESFDSSQETNAARSRAEVSLWWTEDTPQLPQHHLCDPALVLPFLFIADPQDGHLLLSMALLRKTDFLPWFSLHELVIRQYPDTLLSERKSRFLRLFP